MNEDMPKINIPPLDRKYELALGIANLINSYYVKKPLEKQTIENVEEIFKDVIRIMNEDSKLLKSEYDINTPTLKYNQIELNRLYKNINTYNDQWYMKTIKAGEEVLITGSKFSDFRFTASSATIEGAVFLPFTTKLKER